jgi:hypothetical protein
VPGLRSRAGLYPGPVSVGWFFIRVLSDAGMRRAGAGAGRRGRVVRKKVAATAACFVLWMEG